MFPPWLVSLVLHLNILILLSLWQGAGAWTNQPGDVTLSFTDPSNGDLPKLETEPTPPSEAVQLKMQMEELAPLVSMMAASETSTDIALVDIERAHQVGQGTATTGSISGVPFESGPRGDPNAAHTGIYGIDAVGNSFVYVFDRSDSMNSTFITTSEGRKPIRFRLFDCAKHELRQSLEQLDHRHRFHVVFYNHQTMMMFGYRALKNMLEATPIVKSHVDTFLYQLDAVGETNHLPALEAALKYRPEVIFLLTDGEAKDDPSRADLDRIAELNQKRTSINVIQICMEPRIDSSLIDLAKENRGRHRFLNLNQLYEAMQKQPEVSPGFD